MITEGGRELSIFVLVMWVGILFTLGACEYASHKDGEHLPWWMYVVIATGWPFVLGVLWVQLQSPTRKAVKHG